MNYSLLVMESAGMMKMATGEGSPLRQGAGTGSRLVFGGYRGLRRRNSRSILFPDVFGYMDIYRRKKSVRGATRGPRGWGRAHGAGAPRCLVVTSKLPWCLLQVSWIASVPKITLPKVSFRLIFLFCETLKQGKNRNWHWALG